MQRQSASHGASVVRCETERLRPRDAARSHIYHAMYAYFDRDNVALPGLARYFNKNSDDERKHAEGLMDFQNRRGGRVLLQSVPQPMSEYEDAEKGDALNVRRRALVGTCAMNDGPKL
jgi:hypothetical protein